MAKHRSAPVGFLHPRRYRSPDIPMAVIRGYARQIAEHFHPNKIILFGSYACGTPHEDSDVDLMVVMPAANEVSQAVRIRLALPAPFPMDLLVRTPEKFQRRIEEGNWFLREVAEKGMVLYASRNASLVAQGRQRRKGRKTTQRNNATAQ